MSKLNMIVCDTKNNENEFMITYPILELEILLINLSNKENRKTYQHIIKSLKI